MGVWWVIVLGGSAALIFRRAYWIVTVGIILDLWYAPIIGGWYVTGLYTLIFAAAAISAEFIRGRFVWSSDA